MEKLVNGILLDKSSNNTCKILCKSCKSWIATIYLNDKDEPEIMTTSSDYIAANKICRSCREIKNG